MTVPVQVWIPFLWASPSDETFSRDWLRAQREWRGEEYVWLDPDGQEVKRWTHRVGNELPQNACLVPSESINGFSILHIDEGRRVHPLFPLPDEWQNTLPPGLYKQWASTMPDIVEGRTFLPFMWPVVNGGTISYQEVEIQLAPGPIMPVTSVDENDWTITSVWPPPNTKAPQTISPEMESERIYGRLSRTTMNIDGKEMNIVVSDKDPEVRAFNFWLQWREPFNVFFPTSGGNDLLLHHAMIKKCIKKIAEGQRDEAARIAETWVSRLTGEAETTLDRAWFMPKVWTNPDGAFVDACEKYDLKDLQDLDDLVYSKQFQQIMSKTVKVRRVQGWLGYFWWEIYQDIVNKITLRFCRQCGSILRGGHTDLQYCSKQENPDCYRKRNAYYQRKRRKGK